MLPQNHRFRRNGGLREATSLKPSEKDINKSLHFRSETQITSPTKATIKKEFEDTISYIIQYQG